MIIAFTVYRAINSKAQYFATVEVTAANIKKSALVKFNSILETRAVLWDSKIIHVLETKHHSSPKPNWNSMTIPLSTQSKVSTYSWKPMALKKSPFRGHPRCPCIFAFSKGMRSIWTLALQWTVCHAYHGNCNNQTKLHGRANPEYLDIFTGIDKLPVIFHIETDPTVIPVQNNPKRMLVPVKAELKSEMMHRLRRSLS